MREKTVIVVFLLVLALTSVGAVAFPEFIKVKSFFTSPITGKVISDSTICGTYSSLVPSSAVASSMANSAFDAAKAIDSNTNTRWIGNASLPYPKWIYVDIGSNKCMSALSLYLFNFSAPLMMDIQVSNDTQNWVTVVERWQVTEELAFVTKPFSETKARYIRLYQTQGPVTTYGTAGEIRVTAAPIITNPATLFCNDSDGGAFATTHGSVTLSNASTVFTYEDICVSDRELREYFCQNSTAENEAVYCNAGCESGVCLKEALSSKNEESGTLEQFYEADNTYSPGEISGIDTEHTSALGCGIYSLTTPRTAVANSQFHNYRAANAIDSSPDSHWFGDPNLAYPKWITLDLGNRRCVNAVDLTVFIWDTPLTLDVQTSTDGKNWQTVAAHWNVFEGGKIERKEFAETAARYIRLYETAGRRPYGTLSEVQVNSAPLEGMPTGARVQIENIIGGPESEVFYEIGGSRAYIEIDGKLVDEYF